MTAMTAALKIIIGKKINIKKRDKHPVFFKTLKKEEK